MCPLITRPPSWHALPCITTPAQLAIPTAPSPHRPADGGHVAFGADALRVFSEWFGAAGNGRADDSWALQLVADAAASHSRRYCRT